jgi:hypothetical protein
MQKDRCIMSAQFAAAVEQLAAIFRDFEGGVDLRSGYRTRLLVEKGLLKDHVEAVAQYLAQDGRVLQAGDLRLEYKRAYGAIFPVTLDSLPPESEEDRRRDLHRACNKIRSILAACLTAASPPVAGGRGGDQAAGGDKNGGTSALGKDLPPGPGSEPVLSQDNYERILGILQSMSVYIERNPTTFAALDEEGIRDHFLLQLNGHFKGGATGETLNGFGKTDILVRVGDRNIFIAECKFWHGQEKFGEAIDQLLGYLTWHDCKCALLIFNRNKGTTAVAKKMHESMTARKEYKQTLAHDLKGDSRYLFVKADDSSGEILITTQLFDVPRR